MRHWTQDLHADERAVLQAALVFSQTGKVPALTEKQIDLSATMTNEIDDASHDRFANFGARVPGEDIEKLRALFYAAFREQPDTLNEIIEEDPVVFYEIWDGLGISEDVARAVEAEVENIARRKGWFVQEAEDGQFYYNWYHGDADQEGEHATEAEAWLAASKDNSRVTQLIPPHPDPVRRALQTVLIPSDVKKVMAALSDAGLEVIPAARATIYDVVDTIIDYDRQCAAAEYTDTGMVWQIFHQIRDQLTPLLSDRQRKKLEIEQDDYERREDICRRSDLGLDEWNGLTAEEQNRRLAEHRALYVKEGDDFQLRVPNPDTLLLVDLVPNRDVTLRIADIQWDVSSDNDEGDAESPALPTELLAGAPSDWEEEGRLADLLSDHFGFCINSIGRVEVAKDAA